MAEQIKPETLLEAKITKLKLSYFRHIMISQCSLGKTIMSGKTGDSRKNGGPNVRWIDSIKEARGMSLQVLRKAVKDRTLWTALMGLPGIGADSMACNTHITIRPLYSTYTQY